MVGVVEKEEEEEEEETAEVFLFLTHALFAREHLDLFFATLA